MWECVCLYGVDLLNFTIIFHGNTYLYMLVLLVMHHLPPLPSHTQQELVTSGIIPEFAEEIVEVAEGGEMVRKERRGEGGRGKAREERGREGGVEGEMKGEEQKRDVGKKVHRESGVTKEEREGGNEACIVGGRKGERKKIMKEDGKRGKVSSAIETAYYL